MVGLAPKMDTVQCNISPIAAKLSSHEKVLKVRNMWDKDKSETRIGVRRCKRQQNKVAKVPKYNFRAKIVYE